MTRSPKKAEIYNHKYFIQTRGYETRGDNLIRITNFKLSAKIFSKPPIASLTL